MQRKAPHEGMRKARKSAALIIAEKDIAELKEDVAGVKSDIKDVHSLIYKVAGTIITGLVGGFGTLFFYLLKGH